MCWENSQNEQKENAAVDFLKYMLSEKVQKRILEETEQIPANEHVVLDAYKEAMPRPVPGCFFGAWS